MALLSDAFLRPFEVRPATFGFNGLGRIVFLRTYARVQRDGSLETWPQCVRRVVEGCFRVQRAYLHPSQLLTDDEMRAQAEDMFVRMYDMRFLPAGRGLWAMGTDIVDRRALGAALNSCAFVSTAEGDPVAPFKFLMDLSMLGVGVGFDTKGAGRQALAEPSDDGPTHVIGDTREGWVMALEVLLRPFYDGGALPVFDFSALRPAGVALSTFGGTSSGPEPLRVLLADLRGLYRTHGPRPVTSRLIVDTMNLIGRCVVAGNVRRTAEIAFGDAADEAFLDLKCPERCPERAPWSWVSNNSVFGAVGMDYTAISERILLNGEPGVCWLENMRAYSRMCDAADWRDSKVCGGNPCMEQSLEDREMCNLVETFPARHADIEDYMATLRCALLYAKTVTLVPSGVFDGHRTDAVVARNRRIGCSVSGVTQFLAARSLHQLGTWLRAGYSELRRADEALSNRMGISRSVKLTSVKPSGTVSLLAGATPGMHFPIARFYLRRVRLARANPIVAELRRAGYALEDCVVSPETTVIVCVPVDAGAGVRCAGDVSMWEQLSLAAFLQRFWADNQVSVTVTFQRATTTAADIARALDYHQYQLKSVSFLPTADVGAYPQMPYEAIPEAQYREAVAALRAIRDATAADHADEVYCDGDACML